MIMINCAVSGVWCWYHWGLTNHIFALRTAFCALGSHGSRASHFGKECEHVKKGKDFCFEYERGNRMWSL